MNVTVGASRLGYFSAFARQMVTFGGLLTRQIGCTPVDALTAHNLACPC